MGHRAAPDPASPNRVKRLRDKYEAELSELEQSERKLHGLAFLFLSPCHQITNLPLTYLRQGIN